MKTWLDERPYMTQTHEYERLKREMEPTREFIAWVTLNLKGAVIAIPDWGAALCAYGQIDPAMLISEDRAMEAWKAREPKPVTPTPGAKVWVIQQTEYWGGRVVATDFLYTDENEQHLLCYATEAEAEYALPRDNEDQTYQVFGYIVSADGN